MLLALLAAPPSHRKRTSMKCATCEKALGICTCIHPYQPKRRNRVIPIRKVEEQQVGKLTGKIEGQQGTFECMVYYYPHKAAEAGKPNAYFIGLARKVSDD